MIGHWSLCHEDCPDRLMWELLDGRNLVDLFDSLLFVISIMGAPSTMLHNVLFSLIIEDVQKTHKFNKMTNIFRILGNMEEKAKDVE